MNPELYTAAMEGKIDVLRRHKDQLDHQLTPRDNTALHVAAQFHDNGECVKEMLHLQPSLLRRVNSKGETVLHIAARRGCSNTVKELLAFAKALESEDPEREVSITKELLWMKTHEEKEIALHEAVRNNHPDVVELLVEEDPVFSHVANSSEETPLYIAAERNYCKIVSTILTTCRNPAHGGPNGRTGLHAAVVANCQDCAKILLDKKPELIREIDSYGWTPLHLAARFDFEEQTRQLLNVDKSAAYLTADKDDKMTALHLTARHGSVKTMKELLSHCPDSWEMVNVWGQNILHIAVKYEKVKVIKFLLNNSLLISNLLSEKDVVGNTPLHLLAASDCKIPELISHQAADKGAFNKKNQTPRDIAVSIEEYRLHEDDIKKELKNANAPRGRRNIASKDKDKFKKWKSARAQYKREIEENWSTKFESTILVAALIVTITFAAGFTLPGGYNDNDGPNQGTAILIRKAAFKAFVISNTIAVAFSISALFLLLIASFYNIQSKLVTRSSLGFFFLLVALGATTVSFITGSFSILEPSLGLRITVCIIGCFPFPIFYVLLRKFFHD